MNKHHGDKGELAYAHAEKKRRGADPGPEAVEDFLHFHDPQEFEEAHKPDEAAHPQGSNQTHRIRHVLPNFYGQDGHPLRHQNQEVEEKPRVYVLPCDRRSLHLKHPIHVDSSEKRQSSVQSPEQNHQYIHDPQGSISL
eukprot:CAMPEP_0115078208 /NCGR_PEP_ID=MMETSP0227-20121206/17429_1 /TAXON_ID=89957 /ORGANISM="Polarella glacialis, Strain CCMP 1383" /LENGTH=138 /DNA_ID=CAMNT_0002465583 /DNA_START=1051 /DNA_END=1467 /DNA_ORIENTATION=+